MENQVYVINSMWVSNNLLFSIFSSLLTGVVIALFMEVTQYQIHKNAARKDLYQHIVLAYSDIKTFNKKLNEQRNHPDLVMPSNMVDLYMPPARKSINGFIYVDYNTFLKSDALYKQARETAAFLNAKVIPFLFNADDLKIAMAEDQILNINEYGISKNTTYGNSVYTKRTIDLLLLDVEPLVEDFEQHVDQIANICGLMDNWESIRKQLYENA